VEFLIFFKELFSYGMMPYGIMPNEEIIVEVRNGYRLPKPQDCPTEIYELMEKCWDAKPHARPQFETIYNTIDKVFLICILKEHYLYRR
jgi:hypothetical protein